MSSLSSHEGSTGTRVSHVKVSLKSTLRQPQTIVSKSPFLLWAEKENVVKSLPLHHLKGSKIGIDAIMFLESLGPEGLLAALGGTPISLGARITDAILHLQEAGLSLHFVFDGLDYGIGKDLLKHSISNAKAISDGFARYDASEVEEARRIFQGIDTDFTLLTRTCQKTLNELGIPFSVAPYSAMAQLAYYDRHDKQFVDAVYGRPEIFCFGVDKLITSFDQLASLGTPTSSESFVSWVSRKECLQILGNPPAQVFVDALMISGSVLLPPFPLLAKVPREKNKHVIRDAVALIGGAGGSVLRLCAQSSDPLVRDAYRDQYKRAVASLRHHVIVTADGDIEVQNKNLAHGITDTPAFIGLRLPEELFVYLMYGIIQPQVLMYLTSGNVGIFAPDSGGESTEFRRLLRDQLQPLRTLSVSILANQINRYFQVKEISTSIWFDRDFEGKFTSKSFQDSSTCRLKRWHINDTDTRMDAQSRFKPGTLAFAIHCLGDLNDATRTNVPLLMADKAQSLSSTNEIFTNINLRLLRFRGYTDNEDRLSQWGKVLETALLNHHFTNEMQEAIFLAIELIRFGLLTPDPMFANLGGVPLYGSDTDKRNCILISRVACLGNIRHNRRGYTGPLSKHLRSYQCIVASIKSTLRECLEMTLAAMLLEGSISRDRDDWMRLGLGLPFYDEQSCALGVLTMHYLDELCNRKEPTAIATKTETRREGQESWLAGSQFNESLDDAFRLWDAVYEAVRAAGPMMRDRGLWDDVDSWLTNRR